MTLNTSTNRTRNASLLFALFASLFYHPLPTRALGMVGTLPNFAEFSKAVQNGDAKALRGVYVDNLFALPIVQQPSDNPAFVSRNDGEITQFSMAAKYGNIGLLAHNDLSGKLFSSLALGQQVRLIYGNGRVESFVISEVMHYQALQPNSPYSLFRNIEKDDGTVSAQQMFRLAYLGDHHLTFQTCIEAYGDPSWGRLFVVAQPVSDTISMDRPGIEKLQ